MKLKSFSNLHTFHPGLAYLFDLSGDASMPIQMDNLFSAVTAEHSVQEPKIVHLDLDMKGSDDYESRSAFLKVTHLLDPITWMRGKYEFSEESTPDFFTPSSLPTKAREKISDPMNQAYVEAVASYLLSKLREANVSPHFHYFYGAYCGIADSYIYNISDVYSSYRHCRWFWDNQEKGVFKLELDDPDIDEEVREVILQPPSELHSEVSSEVSSEDDDIEELDENESSVEKDVPDQVELQSLHSTEMSSVSFKSQSEETHESEDEEDEDYEEDEDEINVLAKLKDFPVMLLMTEPSQGTMDDLLGGWEDAEITPGEKQWEDIWTAWLFQILAALSVLQSFFGFTHNDLHTNNIVWSKTDEKYFYYQNREGTVWRIPTYGKVFRLIDFGRSIFWVNDKLFFSDDFKDGNDAAEQFSFGPLRAKDSEDEEVYPNPSFDLCRLAVSLFEALFPMKPEPRKNGSILSNEPGLIVRESKSDLYNMLWSWMIDDDGQNVLMEPNGRERYPDFDLYKVITQKVHNAVPKVQILRPIFDKFKIGKPSVGKKNRVYNLFF